MLDTLLNLLPKVGSAVLMLPEFVALVKSVGATLSTGDQATLKTAYALAIEDSDEANADLAALIAERLA